MRFSFGSVVSIRALAFVLAMAVLGSACSDAAEESLGSQGLAGAADESTSSPEQLQFEQLWAAYLETYDSVMQDGASASELEGIATADAIAALDELGALNQQRIEDYEYNGLSEVSSSMNVVSSPSEDSPVLRDCTTHLVGASLGEPFEIYADQEVRFVQDGSGWRISSVEVFQDGWIGEEFGCIPARYGDEALRVAEVFQAGALQFESDPSQQLSEGLLSISSDELAQQMEFARSELEEIGLYADAPTDVFLAVRGLSFRYASAEGPVVRVQSCVVYPEGQTLRSVSDDEVVEEALPPGGSVGTGIDVLVREGFVGEVVAVAPLGTEVC